MKILLVFLSFTSIWANSQSVEAYINDPDGYANVRAQQSSKSVIVGSILTGELFVCEPTKDSPWWKITKSEGEKGFVHKSRIVTIEAKVVEIDQLLNDIRTTDPGNVEFSEISNEELYLFAEHFPKAFLISFNNSNTETKRMIEDQLATPIHDLIPLQLIYDRMDDLTGFPESMGRILKAIEEAGKKLGINVTEKQN